MKRGTTETFKFKKLKRRLGMTEWQVTGLLESIWNLAIVSAPAGDIGKLSNEDIAASIEYEQDPDELVKHLVACGWLEEDPEFRLYVHDWSDHVPNFIRGNFAKHKKMFADQVAKQRQSGVEPPAKDVANPPEQPTSSLVKSSPVNSSQAKHTHTHRASDLKNHSQVPEGCQDAWGRWIDSWDTRCGQRFCPITAEQQLIELNRRGPEKALADIEFSIMKFSKSILDSENDFQKRGEKKPKARRFGE